MEIRKCRECGFILGMRPRSKEEDGICLACANRHRKDGIDWGGAPGMAYGLSGRTPESCRTVGRGGWRVGRKGFVRNCQKTD